MWRWLAKITGGVSLALIGTLFLALIVLVLGGVWIMLTFLWE